MRDGKWTFEVLLDGAVQPEHVIEGRTVVESVPGKKFSLRAVYHGSEMNCIDVLVDGKLELVEDWGINDHTAFVDKLEGSKVFAEALEDEKVQNLANYFFQLPSEVAMKLWTVMGQPDNNLTNTIRLHQAKVGEVVISSRMVEMLKADDSE